MELRRKTVRFFPMKITPAFEPAKPVERLHRGMWVWKFPAITAAQGGGAAVLRSAVKAGVTDLYLYVPLKGYQSQAADLRAFNAKAHALGVRVWGLDGARAYFSDGDGPREFHAHINNLLAFNAGAAANERFHGFQADNEPADRDHFTSFHNGIPQSKLSASQAASRQNLMHGWLTMHADAQRALHRGNVRFGAAMPHWLSHYEDEAITVRYPNPASPPAQVMHHMMAVVDDYVVMSYNTNPDVVMHLMDDALDYASALPANERPSVQAAVETSCGVGSRVSYGDTEGKNSRDVVLNDIAVVCETLAPKYAAFAGVSIHQWPAWDALDR